MNIDSSRCSSKQETRAETEYSFARKQAIYSVRSEYALNNVVKYSEEANDWQKAVDAHIQLCDFFEHSGQTDANFQEAHSYNWAKRVKYYLPTIAAYLKLKNRPQAIQVIHRAINILPDLSCFEAAELGAAAVRCGNTQLAETLAQRSQGCLEKENSWSAGFEKLAALWKELGHEAKAAVVTQLQEAKGQQEELQQRKISDGSSVLRRN